MDKALDFYKPFAFQDFYSLPAPLSPRDNISFLLLHTLFTPPQRCVNNRLGSVTMRVGASLITQ